MSFESEFLSIYNKKKKKQKEETITKTDSFTEELLKLRQNEINEFQQKKSQNTNTESKKASGFFKKSEAFTDFDANNASKLGITAIATAGDISARILQGFGNHFEGIADIATYLVSGAADLVGADRFSKKSKKFAQTQWVDKFANQYMKDMEAYSILGDKSDAVSQGIGQVMSMYVTAGLGTKAKLGQKAVSALTTGTNFASATGHGLTEAYNEGATDGEAWGYGLLKGGVEAGSEAVFGGLGKGANALGIGKGLSSADDMLAKALTKKITNRFLSNAGQLAVKAGGEGLEEVLAGVGTAVAKKLSYKKNNGENLWKLIEDEKLFDSFITGVLTSGIAQGSGAIRATKTDTDLVSGLNRKEENVVQAVYDSRLADKQKDGKKLSALKKNKLWDDITTEMKRGEISTDDIESVLGGDTYKQYKSRIDQVENIQKKIDALQTEHDDLNKKLPAEMRGIDNDRLAELKKELPKLKSQYKHWTSDAKAQEVADLKAKLSSEVYALTKGTNLAESYNELARRKQAFTADLSQYNEKEAAIVQKAIDSGIINNTNRSREFVDLVARLAAAKDLDFDFTTNKRLAESGFAIDGVTINGMVDKNTKAVTINMNSAKALETVVGHEITHILENTDLYDALAESVKQYATTKGEYKSRLEAITKLYANEEGADVVKELTADLVGDYIFSDADFVNSLAKGNRNLAQKILDEIKYMAKIATAGSKEKRQLEKAKKMLKDALESSVDVKKQTDTQTQSKPKLSISETTDGRIVAVVDSDILDNIDTTSWDDEKKDTAKKAASIALKQFNNGIVVDGITRKVNRTSRKEYTRSNYTESLYKKAPDVFADKMRAADIVDDIVVATTNWSRDGGLKHQRDDNFVDFDHGTTLIMSGNAKYSAEVVVGITDSGEAVFYDVVDMTPTSFDIKKEETSTTATTQNAIGDIQEVSSDDILPQNPKKSSINYSLSPEQQEYFKDSVVRDNGGNLKVMYHGSPESFTVFDKSKAKSGGTYGKGFYFTDSTSHAATYGKAYEVYLNITNPVQNDTYNITKQQLQNFVEALAEDEDYGIDNYGYGATVDSVTDSVYGKSDFAMLLDLNISCVGDMVSAIELFNKVNGTNYDGIIAPTETVAFYPEQIKNIDNKAPTINPDMNKSLSPADTTESGRFMGKDIALEDEVFNVEKTPAVAPVRQDIAKNATTTQKRKIAPLPTQSTRAIAPTKADVQRGAAIATADTGKGKQRSFVETAIKSDVVDEQILPEDLVQGKIYYEPVSNKKTLEKANRSLDRLGYDEAVKHFNNRFETDTVALEDIVLGERLIQESVAKGDFKTAGELIENVAILGTELGQKVQALSIIQRLTPAGQLRMLENTISRAQAKGLKEFDGIKLTEEQRNKILSAYNADGKSYDQDKLNAAINEITSEIADKMKSTVGEKLTAWRYLSMLGNVKTHLRNTFSNIVNFVTIQGKNAVARTTEAVVSKIGKKSPFEYRTKIWKSASQDVKDFAKETVEKEKDLIKGNRYDDAKSKIMAKRKVFGKTILQKVYDFNSDALGYEDWVFSKFWYKDALSEFLTANGIKTKSDIENNPELVAKAKKYALEQAEIATFRQASWLANKIGEIERKNKLAKVAVGAVIPFKKTPINVAKAGFNYSPLGFAKTLTYDIGKVKSGDMDATTLVDHLAQNVTGTTLVFLGYWLAQMGMLNGAGGSDKEDKYDYQLGKQQYSINLGGSTYSLNWVTPAAMPLFVGANFFEAFEEEKEWNGDVVLQSMAQVLDPMSDMSFLSSLNDALSSYEQGGMKKFLGIAESMAQNYITQYIPTASGQLAATIDTKKRSTKASGDSGFEFFNETIRKIQYKIPGLRNFLEPTMDIWGNEIKQDDRELVRALENFVSPSIRKQYSNTNVDDTIKELYQQTGDTGLIPSVPYDNIKFKGTQYNMSSKDFTQYKQTYGQSAYELMTKLFKTNTYKNAPFDEQADMVNRVYDYARDQAKKELLASRGVEYTNATKDKVEIYRDNYIKGAIENDVTVDEYEFMYNNPEKYKFLSDNGITFTDYKNADEDGKEAYSWAYNNQDKYEMAKIITPDVIKYKSFTNAISKLEADKKPNGTSISGSLKKKVVNYINSLDIDYYGKMVLYRSEYPSDDRYNADIVEYLDSRDDITYSQMVTILDELGMKVKNGRVTW